MGHISCRYGNATLTWQREKHVNCLRLVYVGVSLHIVRLKITLPEIDLSIIWTGETAYAKVAPSRIGDKSSWKSALLSLRFAGNLVVTARFDAIELLTAGLIPTMKTGIRRYA
jgi:hypothetical protein